jgi:hypothetical protein
MKRCDSMFSRGIASGCTDLRNGSFKLKFLVVRPGREV